MFGLFGNPSRSKFAKIVMDAARKAGFSKDLAFDEADFSIQHGSGRLFLGNFYDEYCAADRARKKMLLSNVSAVMAESDALVSREEALEQVVVVVREKAMFSFLKLRQQIQGGKSASVVMEPLTDWFVRTLVIDAPSSMRVVMETDLKEWGVSAEELFEIGFERLKDCSTPKFVQENGYFVGNWDDDYDSSRVLLEDLFEDLAINGAPVMCIPNRRMLLVADSANAGGVRAMLSKAEEIVQSNPRPQNPGPLTFQDGEVVDFEVPPDSDLFDAVRRARGLCGMIYYAEQKELLDALHENTGKDIYVGKFTLTQREDGSHMSYCIWSRNVPSLLPKTDVILFNDPTPDGEARTVAVKWEEAAKGVGDLMLDAEMFPPRFYVSKFPTPDEFAKMAAVPIS